jgi:hypothetical protein
MRNMELITENEQAKEMLKETQKKEKSGIIKCEFCGKRIVRNTWNKKYRLINVCQQPPKRFFCSNQCKLRWIFKNE